MPKDGEPNTLTVTLMMIIAVTTFLCAFFTPRKSEFLPFFDEVILTLLTLITEFVYIIGGGIVFFGALVIIVRFIQSKLKNPDKPSGVTRYLSGYLTLSLELFIGAEIIKTTITRTFEEFSVLILIIISRGLFSLILYLERRWHGIAETE
ncbi:MAG: DUF1622 domain-containing protein [Candidatus Bathyarchaeota archaeon]|nr:DUF1622 domain-containing protein [Candidatus Bathyarchaeota archaeon]MCX8176866.1 DUF1622 domain-containing protein [Candidatus Bathyarchaeota archaeon]MDW8193449.1 DUF1622 domain-containing protein [Nitrososphaerota archaeon]